MLRPNFVADDVTGHPSVPPGNFETDRVLHSQVAWEGEGYPPAPNAPAFTEPVEFPRPGLMSVREHFVERFQRDMIA